MSKDHPITPPDHLLSHWKEVIDYDYSPSHIEVEEMLTQSARWGADQELEACCEWLLDGKRENLSQVITLRSARRPKPPSLKEQALETLRSMQIEPVILDGINVNKEVMDKYDIIRRALELLPD